LWKSMHGAAATPPPPGPNAVFEDEKTKLRTGGDD
jgi:hypothetical protein